MSTDRSASSPKEPSKAHHFPDTDATHTPTRNLGRTSRAGARWQGLSQIVEFTSATAIMVLLAHYVSPSEFGLVALATAAVGLLAGILVSPISSAVVARQLPPGPPLDTAWWMAVAPCLTIYTVTVSSAFALGLRGMGFGILFGVGLSLPFIAAMQILTSHLQQQLTFRLLSVARLIGTVCGTAVALGLLALGEPLTALIVRTSLTPMLQGASMALGGKWLPRLRINRSTRREIVTYARGVAGFNAVNQFSRKGDDLIVGSLVSSQALGFYSIAYRFIEVPVSQVAQVAQNVAFPALVRMKDEGEMRAAFLRSQHLLVWLVAPISIASVALGDLAVPAFLGSNWQEAGPIVQIFGVIAFLQTAGTQAGIIYLYRSATGLLMRWGIVSASTIVLCFVIGAHWGALGVAWAYLVANLVLFYPSWAIPGRLISMAPLTVMRNLIGTSLVAVLVVCVLILMRNLVPLNDPIVLVPVIAGSSVLFWLLSVLIDPPLRRDVRATLLPEAQESSMAAHSHN